MVGSLGSWTKVVMQPLGLAGFALFLVFGLIANRKRKAPHNWLFPAALGMAVLALIGGISLSYVQMTQRAAAASKATPPSQVKVEQKSSGACSPNIADVKGDVTYTVDGSACAQAAPDQQPGGAKQAGSK